MRNPWALTVEVNERAAHRGLLTPTELEALPGRRPLQTVGSGAFLFRQGQHLDHVFIIRVGLVALSQQVGSRRRVLTLLGDGDVLGDVPVLAGTPAPFDARAVADTTYLSLPAAALFAALDRNPELGKRWILSLSARLARCQARLGDVLAGDLRTRVATFLAHEFARSPRLSLTQQLLADLLGSRRTSVNRVLQELEARGAIELRYGEIRVVDLDTVSAIAGLDHEAPI